MRARENDGRRAAFEFKSVNQAMEQGACTRFPWREHPKEAFNERSRRKSPDIFDGYNSESRPRYQFQILNR